MEKVKFTLADSLTIIAGMIYGSIAFLGAKYLYFERNEVLGLSNTLGCIIIAVLSALSLIIPAYLAKLFKTVDRNFKVAFKIEVTSLVLFLGIGFYSLMYSPFNHYFTIYSQSKNILMDVKISINSTRQMFLDYEAYCSKRIKYYERDLKILYQSKPDSLSHLNFDPELELFTLKALLYPSNYSDSSNKNGIKESAFEILNEYDRNTNLWPAFGIIEITSNLNERSNEWSQQLIKNSEKKGMFETYLGAFTYKNKVTAITDNFKTKGKPTMLCFSTCIFLYAIMLFSYLIANRSTRVSLKDLIKSSKRNLNEL